MDKPSFRRSFRDGANRLVFRAPGTTQDRAVGTGRNCGSVALIQVLDMVLQRFGLPEQAARFIVVTLTVGSFVAIA